MAAHDTHRVTFEDAWAYLKEIEDATGAHLAITLHPPRTVKGGGIYRARVALTGTRRERGKDRERTAYCEIGGARGARTVPAALIRAALELSARLDAETEVAAQLAAF